MLSLGVALYLWIVVGKEKNLMLLQVVAHILFTISPLLITAKGNVGMVMEGH